MEAFDEMGKKGDTVKRKEEAWNREERDTEIDKLIKRKQEKIDMEIRKMRRGD